MSEIHGHDCLFIDSEGDVLDTFEDYQRAITDTTKRYGSCFIEVVRASCWLYQIMRPSDVMVMRNPDRHANLPVLPDSARAPTQRLV